MKAVIGFVAAAAVVEAQDKYEKMWNDFKLDYGKDYSNSDEESRFVIFKKNVDYIEESNAKQSSFTLAVNEFADMTLEEFKNTRLGLRPPVYTDLPKVPFQGINPAAPDSIDWVAKGAVTPVKNQGGCGSCWAFSTTGSIEGAYFVATGKLKSLSEQQLVDCDRGTGDQGCQGGLMDTAFAYVKTNGGLCTEDCYKYHSGTVPVSGACNKKCVPEVDVSGFTDVPYKDEDAMKTAVAQQPVSVAVNGASPVFQFYHGGVIDNVLCTASLDHGVLAVGYGTASGKDYWKVKNSWGKSWGESGYLRIVRGKDMCGIAMNASYPTGATDTGKAPAAPCPAPPPGCPFNTCGGCDNFCSGHQGSAGCSSGTMGLHCKCGDGSKCDDAMNFDDSVVV